MDVRGGVALPPQPDLLDPVHDRGRFDQVIEIPDRWDTDHWPLQYFDLQAGLDGLRAQLPPRDDVAPAYLVSMYRDGVMEYGTTLEPALRRENPADNRIIFRRFVRFGGEVHRGSSIVMPAQQR